MYPRLKRKNQKPSKRQQQVGGSRKQKRPSINSFLLLLLLLLSVEIIMEPYSMCSKQEFVERIQCHEISIFERNSNYDGSPDPGKVIAKYRRSAAGSRQRTPRSLRQLSLTVRYLVQAPTTTTFLAAVQFFEDRIRAVQVDLTRSSSRPATGRNNNHNNNNNHSNDDSELIAPLQVMIGRAQILILFLMSSIREDDVLDEKSKNNRPPKNNHHYERKFGVTALQTALTSYLACIQRVQNGQRNEWKDQMMAFSILSMVNEMLRSACSSSSGGGATTTATPEIGHVWMEVVRLARTTNSKQQPANPFFGPRTQRAVRLLLKICRGEWQQAMAQLRQPNDPDNGRSWTIVEQCCIDQEARRYLQWRTLQTFNVVLSKGQTITVTELARLLNIDQDESGSSGGADDDDATSRRTVQQLVRRFGLPMTDTGDKVIFKEVAMLPPSANAQPPNESSIVASNVMTSTGSDSKPKLALLPLIMDGLAVETA
jgi:SAC3/GANP family